MLPLHCLDIDDALEHFPIATKSFSWQKKSLQNFKKVFDVKKNHTKCFSKTVVNKTGDTWGSSTSVSLETLTDISFVGQNFCFTKCLSPKKSFVFFAHFSSFTFAPRSHKVIENQDKRILMSNIDLFRFSIISESTLEVLEIFTNDAYLQKIKINKVLNCQNPWHHFGIDYVTSICFSVNVLINIHILVCKIHTNYVTNAKSWRTITYLMSYPWPKFEVNTTCRSQDTLHENMRLTIKDFFS